MSHGFTQHATYDFSLSKHGKTFIKPEMLKVLVGHKISRPGMGNLMGNHAGQTLITGLIWIVTDCHSHPFILISFSPFLYQKGGRGKGQTRVFHASVGKTGRQHQNVIDTPNIWSIEVFSGLEHLLGLRELESRFVHEFLFAPNVRARANPTGFQVSNGNGNQIWLMDQKKRKKKKRNNGPNLGCWN